MFLQEIVEAQFYQAIRNSEFKEKNLPMAEYVKVSRKYLAYEMCWLFFPWVEDRSCCLCYITGGR